MKEFIKKTRVLVFIIAILTLILYFWFALLPSLFRFSFPTGNWDWLNYLTTVIGFSITYWGITQTINQSSLEMTETIRQLNKDREIQYKPCLDVSLSRRFKNDLKNEFKERDSFNNLFMKKENGIDVIKNDGFFFIENQINSDSTNQRLNDINNKNIKIEVSNIGANTIHGVSIYLKKLVEGYEKFSKGEPHDNIYENLKYINYDIEEKEGNQYIKRPNKNWLIAPERNMGHANNNEFTIYLGIDKVKGEFHNILRFDFENSYGIKYFQLVQLSIYSDGKFATYPISKVYESV